jgi:16S rRNA (cytosine967-C5)-methyltransferase
LLICEGYPVLKHSLHRGEKPGVKVSAARIAAYETLSRIEVARNFAVDLLQAPDVSRLKAVDRNLTTQLVMGVLRWRGDLDHQIECLSGKPLGDFDSEIVQILRLGIYQIRFLSRIPKSAAVNEAVELVKAARKKSAAGLVNAVLRKCERIPFGSSDVSDKYSDQEYLKSALRSVPEWIRARWIRNFGPEAATAIVLASQEIPHTFVRAMTPGDEREKVQRELAEEGVQTRLGVYGPRALQVESGDVFSTTAWRQGRIVVQEEASQAVGELVQPRPGDCVLDVCAAPGLKTGQIAERLRKGILVASDLSLRRIKLMERVLPGLRLADLHISRAVLDACCPLPFRLLFDRVLADVPCSGTGTLARNPEIKWRLRPEDLPRLAETQTKILGNALERLAPRGRLVYSTCSLEPEENEQVVMKALTERPEYRLAKPCELRDELPALADLFDEKGYFRTWPGVHRMDGFFAAVITPNLKPQSVVCKARLGSDGCELLRSTRDTTRVARGHGL